MIGTQPIFLLFNLFLRWRSKERQSERHRERERERKGLEHVINGNRKKKENLRIRWN